MNITFLKYTRIDSRKFYNLKIKIKIYKMFSLSSYYIHHKSFKLKDYTDSIVYVKLGVKKNNNNLKSTT